MTTWAGLLGQGGGDWPLWSPSLTVAQWATVRSPADGEIYTRRTATGSGSVDPADDLVNYFSPGYDRVTAVTGAIGSIAAGGTPLPVYARNAAKASWPAISANTRTLVLSVAGRGLASFFGYTCGSSTRTVRAEVIVDGRTVYDNTVVHVANGVCTIIGSAVQVDTLPVANAVDDPAGIPFRRSFAVYVTPTTAMTVGDGAGIAHKIRSLA